MIAKVISLIAVGVMIALLIFRARGRSEQEGPLRLAPARSGGRAVDPRALMVCPECGATHAKSDLCDCERAPAP